MRESVILKRKRGNNMGILERFSQIMSANINALLDKCEDPVKMIDQTLREMNENLAEVKSATASIMAEEKKCKREVDSIQEEISKWENIAKKALMAGNEEDAKVALQKKMDAQTQLETAQKTLDAATANSNKMKQMYNKLSSDIAALNERRSLIKSQVSMAKATEKANKISSLSNTEEAMSAFSRMEEKSQRMLDEAMAHAELNEKPADEADALLDKYAETGSAEVNAELEKLKKEMGL